MTTYKMATKTTISRNGWTLSDEVHVTGMRHKLKIQNGQCSETEQAI